QKRMRNEKRASLRQSISTPRPPSNAASAPIFPFHSPTSDAQPENSPHPYATTELVASMTNPIANSKQPTRFRMGFVFSKAQKAQRVLQPLPPFLPSDPMR